MRFRLGIKEQEEVGWLVGRGLARLCGLRLRPIGADDMIAIQRQLSDDRRADTACERPVRLFLSGPAAGAIGASYVGRLAG